MRTGTIGCDLTDGLGGSTPFLTSIGMVFLSALDIHSALNLCGLVVSILSDIVLPM